MLTNWTAQDYFFVAIGFSFAVLLLSISFAVVWLAVV